VHGERWLVSSLSTFDPDVTSVRGRLRQSPTGILTVRLAGPLDITTGHALEELLIAAVSVGPRLIILDLSDVDFIDCHSIGLIIAARNVAEARGGSLRVDVPTGAPQRLFDHLGLRSSLTTWAKDRMGGQDVREFQAAGWVA
jgi:anti-sigma B factor antagonist